MVLVGIQQSLILLLCFRLRAKHGSHSLQAFHAEYYLWHCQWQEPGWGDWQPWTLYSKHSNSRCKACRYPHLFHHQSFVEKFHFDVPTQGDRILHTHVVGVVSLANTIVDGRGVDLHFQLMNFKHWSCDQKQGQITWRSTISPSFLWGYNKRIQGKQMLRQFTLHILK